MAGTSAGDKTITGYLKRIIGSPVGQVIPLFESDICIGRTKNSDICIHDPNISRSHCTLNYSTDGWFITDLGGVNGTYLDSNKLMPLITHPLKDGLGIYLGPPEEAPVAFVFIKNKQVEESPKEPQEHLQSKTEPLNDEIEDKLQSNQPTLKRSTKINNHSSRSKKPAPSTSTHQPVSSQSTTDGQDSDISIASLDSLRTRIRKMNSQKKKKSYSNTRNNLNIASTSASPSLRPISPKFDCIPSTSSAGQVTKPSGKSPVSEKLTHLKKTMPAGVFRELETLFDDGSDSLTETANLREDSESLLNDSMLLSNAGPNPSALNLEVELSRGAKKKSKGAISEKSQQKKKLKNLNEQLKKAHGQLLKENSEQKQKLDQFIKASTSKKEPSEKLGDMLEEELICNICTEVFIKATTLGCSHTFCEHCIMEWKKKQKRCPMCREMITSETRILIMDNFIDKVVEKLDKDYQDKRKEVIARREAAKANAKVKKTKRKKSSRSRASSRAATSAVRPIRTERADELMQWRLNLLNEIPFHLEEMAYEMSSGSDDNIIEEMLPICVFCGEAGDHSNNCPMAN